MKIVEAAVQSVGQKARRAIENIGVEIPKQTSPVSKKIRGRGEIRPRPGRAQTLKVFGTGSRRAVMRFASQYPDRVVEALNPQGLLALQNPSAAEAAFHQQRAEKNSSDIYGTPVAERKLGVVEFQPDDERIKFIGEIYNLDPGSIKPKILTDQSGRPVLVEDLIRPGGKIVGGPEMPVETAPRPVLVPDIAGALAEKNAQDVIALLGLVDTTRPEAVSSRQAAVRQAVVEAAGRGAMGLTPEFVRFTVQAFFSAGENLELPAKEVVSALRVFS